MSRKWHYRRYLPAILGTLVVLSIGAGFIRLVAGLVNDDGAAAKKSVQQITLLAPPPPPPPKMEQEPPEPEIEEEVEVPEPEALEDLPDAPSDEPPGGDALGLDAEGGAGDGFGLAARKGGRGLLSGGAFGWFSKQLQDDIHEALQEAEAVRRRNYSVVAFLWIDEGGRIERAELNKGTGNRELDQAITDALLVARLTKAPPLEMPQPIRIRITSRL